MANLKILSKTMRVGVLRQTAWDSIAADSAAFKTMTYDAGVTIPDPNSQVGLFNQTAMNGLHRENERVYVDGKVGLKRINFRGIADVKTLAPHLAGALFVVTENVSTPFDKTITAGGLTSAIDFANNSGILHTVAIDMGASADDGIVLENAIIDNLTLEFDFLASGIARLGSISGEWVGSTMDFEQTLSGTWTTTTMTPLNDTETYTFTTFDAGVTDVKAELFRKYTLQINNNVTVSAATVDGIPLQYDISPVYSVIVDMDYNAVTEKMLTDVQQQATRQNIDFGNSVSANNNGELAINTPYCISEDVGFVYNGDYNAISKTFGVYSEAAFEVD